MQADTEKHSPVPAPGRRRMPAERWALTHHFSVGGQEGYVTVGLFEDGQPGEIVHQDGQRGINSLRTDGRFCHRSVARFAVRRSTRCSVPEVQPYAL